MLRILAIALLLIGGAPGFLEATDKPPQQAVVDIEWACEGPALNMVGFQRDPRFLEATGFCQDRYAGYTNVFWAKRLADQARFVWRVGIEGTYRLVPSSALVLECIDFNGFELCR